MITREHGGTIDTLFKYRIRTYQGAGTESRRLLILL